MKISPTIDNQTQAPLRNYNWGLWLAVIFVVVAAVAAYATYGKSVPNNLPASNTANSSMHDDGNASSKTSE